MNDFKDDVLTLDNAQELVQFCVNPETNAGSVQSYLGTILREMKEMVLSLSVESSVDEQIIPCKNSLKLARRITDVFQKAAWKNNALKYYYMGEFYAEIRQLEGMLIDYTETTTQEAVSKRKNFLSIISIIYKEQMIRQVDLARLLKMDRSNLSREMDVLVAAGFVEQRKSGKYKLYNLSAQGIRYYSKYAYIKHPDAEAPETVYDGFYKCVDYGLVSLSDKPAPAISTYTGKITYLPVSIDKDYFDSWFNLSLSDKRYELFSCGDQPFRGDICISGD